MTGLVRVMGNVGVLVFWVFLALYFISHEWVTPDWPGKLACVAGVAVGTGAWFAGLSWVVSLGHGKLSEKTLLRMEHYSGAFLADPGARFRAGSSSGRCTTSTELAVLCVPRRARSARPTRFRSSP